MKILLNCNVPFLLAHGGAQIQIEQTRTALEKIGVEVDYLRWWDDSQKADVIHHFGRFSAPLIRLAQDKGIKVVMAELLTEQGSRPRSRIRAQRWVTRLLKLALPGMTASAFDWESYRLADACVALTAHEAWLMTYQFDAPPEKVHVVPNGVEDVFLESKPVARGNWLVCTTTVTERKRVLELAEAAVHAKTPLWVIGKAYADSDPYAARFLGLAKRHPDLIRFEGPIRDRIRLAEAYRQARGFVLLSAMESLSLSALEAAACQCPLLLSDLPWAKTVFRDSVSYCPVTADISRTASALRKFYDAAPNLPPPAKPLTWVEVAHQLKSLYEGVLKTSR
ncbi:MAG TPA: glycosyltransferase family 4 protein [Verrucomicrobiae bacterium]|jgi:glycosyltransferase involved in cell wall biosynthesis|nr:glycosyltransferase family 4 protein [Verrucomicrobiae bacterium]